MEVWVADEAHAAAELPRRFGWTVTDVRRCREGEEARDGDGLAYREYRARVWKGEGRPPIETMPGGTIVRCMAWSLDEAERIFEEEYGHLGKVYELYNEADFESPR